MRKFQLLLSVIALLLAQQVLAADTLTTTTTTSTTADTLKQCQIVAKACTDAGFIKGGARGKTFWRDCMKPLVLGKTVAGVTADPLDIKACRQIKIQHLEKKLNDLNAVSSK